MSGQHILISGGAGFVGSHLAEHILANTDWRITVLDGLTYAGDAARIYEAGKFDRTRVRVLWHDLNSGIMETLARRIGPVDFVVNMASNSHIDASIADPAPFVRNNVNVALHMLEYARAVRPRAFVQISTDEVYGSIEPGGVPYPEWAPINPSNPYSASKAAQVAIAIAYWRTYGVPLIIVEPMNAFGERQDREKFVPKCVRAVLAGEKITLHGTPDNIGSRHYLHARNISDAILFLLRRPVSAYPQVDRPDRYNVVGGRHHNLEMATRIAGILRLPLHYKFDHNPRSRPGHDLHYGLDGAKLAALGWTAPLDFESSLRRAVLWMRDNQDW
jgi:dTDP-glucose 4,6-dehydratase